MLNKLFKKTTVQYDSVLDHMEELSEAEASSVVGGVGYVELAADDRYLPEFDVTDLRLKRLRGELGEVEYDVVGSDRGKFIFEKF